MYVIPSTDKTKFAKTINQIDSWEMALLPWEHHDDPLYSDYRSRKCTFWLGKSSNHKEWALAAIPGSIDQSEGLHLETIYSACTAILVDPPKLQEDAIFKILFLIHSKFKKALWITENTVNEIFGAVVFNEYLPAQNYLPELPKDWLPLPVELCVSFELSENACAPPFIFRDCRRNSLKEALEVLYGPRHDGLLICYALVVRKVTPFLAWNVDWPLSRRGKEAPFKRRKVQGTFPWEYHADQTILAVYQWAPLRGFELSPDYFAQPTIRLIVGGKSQEEAISNWHKCAKALRKMKPSRNRS